MDDGQAQAAPTTDDELVAGNAQAVVTHNVRDLTRGELAWPHLRILTPAQFLEEQP